MKYTSKSAPLPFQGQKRNFITKFKEALKEFPDDSTYVDLFGGSGLLSHTIKTEKPNAKVIYNDYDCYTERLKHIEKTNFLLDDIRILIKEDSKQRVRDSIREQILERIKKESGYVDYITLSGSLLFSGNYATCLEDFEKQTFYNRVAKSAYNAIGYLDDVKVLNEDYKVLFEKYKNIPNVIFILDPPYLSTDVKSYTNKNYWKLTDYLDVLKTIETKPYFYFTSDKSQLVELMNWLETNDYGYNPFKNATTTTTNKVTHNSGYTDMMIYKNN